MSHISLTLIYYSMERLKEWLKLPLMSAQVLQDYSMERLKEWLKHL